MSQGRDTLRPLARLARPIVLASTCLGFDACRFNGQKLGDAFVNALAPLVDFLPVCPEVEIGLGVPRDPLRLVVEAGQVRLVQPATGNDVTVAMHRFATRYLETLPQIDGAVLKGRSPSCAVGDAKIYRSIAQGPVASRGSGLFTARLVERFPGAAIEDEGRLTNFGIREHFLTKLFLNARFRELLANPRRGALVQFQAENKLLLMAYDQTRMRVLGRLVARSKQRPIEAVIRDYEQHLNAAFARAPRYTSYINVFMHVLGYFSKQLSSGERSHFLDLLEDYRAAKIPASAANAVCRSWIARFENDYLDQQTFFAPYPQQLVEITDSGKGRGQSSGRVIRARSPMPS